MSLDSVECHLWTSLKSSHLLRHVMDSSIDFLKDAGYECIVLTMEAFHILQLKH